jgi:hypothetical protein
MRRWKTRITRLAAVTVLAAAAAATPSATAGAKVFSERAGDAQPAQVEVTGGTLPPECAAWAQWTSMELAHVGIVGVQADSYLAQRADNPCHARITPRSLFHAGDPGAV